MRPNGGLSSSYTQNMPSSTGQYSTQAGEPAQPVQHSVITASSFGFFFRAVVMPLERGLIAIVEERVRRQRRKVGPVDRRVRMGRGDIVRRKGKREALPVIDAAGGRNERRCQQRRPRAEIVVSKGRHGVHNAGQQARKLGVKDAVAGSNAALAAASEDRSSGTRGRSAARKRIQFLGAKFL